MGVFNRFFRVAKAEAHSVVDKLEDPIKMTEQGIRDLKRDLQGAMTSLAQVKAASIRLKKDADDQKKLAADYERKAMLLLQKMQHGSLDKAEADRLAAEALSKKEDAMQRATSLTSDHRAQQKMADQLQAKVEKLKQTVSRYENELITLRARARTADSMKKINQQMTKVDSNSTIAMLEKMKDKVMEQESLAEAYGDMADSTAGLDDQIEKALESPAEEKAADSLAELKKKMGIDKK
jgi:phage shock protein A